MKCNPGIGGENKNFKLSPPDYPPSIYVGESSRSLYERGREHWRDFKSKNENSHILKHHVLHHDGEGEPEFHLQLVRTFRTALTRQVHEAVRIQEWGEDRILNSKAEFNRCTIGRLTLGENNTADEERILRERLEDMKSTENKLIREPDCQIPWE